MRVFLTGSGGVLGRAIVRVAAAHDDLEIVTATRAEFDLEAPATIARTIADVAPDVVLHLAALTDTTAAERDPERAHRINSEGTRAVARATHWLGARLIAMSTDLVFPGRDGGLYTETDPTQPLSVYGHTKVAAELAVREHCENALVVRTSLILAPERGHIPALARAIAADCASLFTDERRSPIVDTDLAGALLALARSDFRGILHLAGPALSRYDFGLTIAKGLRLAADRIRPTLRSTAPPPARPGDVSLDSSLASRIGLRPPHSLTAAMGELRARCKEVNQFV